MIALILLYIISEFISVIITEALGIESTDAITAGTIFLTFFIS